MKSKLNSLVKVSLLTASLFIVLSSFASEGEKVASTKKSEARKTIDNKLKKQLNKKMVFPFSSEKNYVGDVTMQLIYVNGNPSSVSFKSNNQDLVDYVQSKVGEMDFNKVENYTGIIDYKLNFKKEN